jgi:hypothetical protein
MKNIVADPPAPTPSTRDELQHVQILIARRADELCTSGRKGHSCDLDYWLQAEREVLGGEPPSLSLSPT